MSAFNIQFGVLVAAASISLGVMATVYIESVKKSDILQEKNYALQERMLEMLEKK